MSPCPFNTILACSTSSLDPFSSRAREMASRSTSRAFEGEAAVAAGPRVRGRSRAGEEMARRGSAASMRRGGRRSSVWRSRRHVGNSGATPEASREARVSGMWLGSGDWERCRIGSSKIETEKRGEEEEVKNWLSEIGRAHV